MSMVNRRYARIVEQKVWLSIKVMWMRGRVIVEVVVDEDEGPEQLATLLEQLLDKLQAWIKIRELKVNVKWEDW